MKTLPIITAITFAIALRTYGMERLVSFDKLPEKVQATIRETVGDGKITQTIEEAEGSHNTYQCAYTVGDKKFEAEVSPEGKLLEIGEPMALSDAPAAVQKSIQDNASGSHLFKFEKATADKKTFYYEAEYSGEHEIRVALDGHVISETKMGVTKNYDTK